MTGRGTPKRSPNSPNRRPFLSRPCARKARRSALALASWWPKSNLGARPPASPLQAHFAIDGEIVVLDVRGVSDFDSLHSGKHNAEAQLYAFDLVDLAGDDLRELPLFERKGELGKLLRGRAEGIFVAPFEPGAIGPDLFRAVCEMGLEGLVSKHRERRYQPRTCDWIKIKNRRRPAMSRQF
ncbi:hypothetical protein [Bradyrhizobium liaoningense]|uniref:ATP-dependent DNA ligase n=1 Tax=Bradyrhizobium liaoningense TaxID=43992 RepID=UPI0032DE47D8